MKAAISQIDRMLQRFTPDPFVIAILLTVLTFVLAALRQDVGFGKAIQIWGNGLWGLSAFTLKMAMILIGGYVVATSPPVNRILKLLVGAIGNATQAVLFCTCVSLLASWVNWGFGLVVGGVVALEVSRRVPKAPFRVLVASSYSGFLVWHGGLSGSIPLALNTQTDEITKSIVGAAIPLSQTTFGNVNLIALACMVGLLPILNWILLKLVGDVDESGQSKATVYRDAQEPESAVSDSAGEPWIERSPLVTIAICLMGAMYFTFIVNEDKFSLNLNSVMSIFFFAGIALHGSPSKFIGSIQQAVPKIGPILIQYPLYAGIMALLIDSGLAQQISRYFAENSSAQTLPLLTFYSAGLVNLFVPSGGGQWAVQAPIVVPAVEQLGADMNKTVMAVAWGYAWTNMLQPFWAVPLLAVAGLKIKDIIGLLLVIFIASGIVLSLVFWLA